MIHLLMTQDDLLNLRFSYSPLFELITSYRLLHCPHYAPTYERWVNETHSILHEVDLPYMEDILLCWSYVPDFLTQTPLKRNLTLEDELAQVFDTPPDVIRADMEALVSEFDTSIIRQLMLMYPKETLLCLLDELRLYWQLVLEAHWSQITHILEGDMLHHGRVMALDGAQTMLDNLTQKTMYCADTQALQLKKENKHLVHQLRGQGLQLLPGMFTMPEHAMWMINPRYRPLVLYDARGAGMWKQSLPESNPSLELALGAGRARVLVALIMPRNTGELARLLEISAGAVSQHLSRLNQAGLVTSRRVGKRVFYQLTDRGENLIALFDATP